MYIFFIFLICRIIMGSAISNWYRYNNLGITNLTLYPIPNGTFLASFYGNSISEIPEGYFAAVPTIKTIYLHLNELSVIKKHMFAGLIQLGRLQLHSNLISTIEPESFKDNCALYQLELHGNALRNIFRILSFVSIEHALLILSHASKVGSPTNHLGSGQRRDMGQGSSSPEHCMYAKYLPRRHGPDFHPGGTQFI